MNQQQVEKQEIRFKGGVFYVVPSFAQRTPDSHVELGMNLIVMQMPDNLCMVASLPPEAARELGRSLQLAAEAIILQRAEMNKI